MEDVTFEQTKALQCSLAHALSRFKIKFSPDKVDTMIVQAIGGCNDHSDVAYRCYAAARRSHLLASQHATPLESQLFFFFFAFAHVLTPACCCLSWTSVMRRAAG